MKNAELRTLYDELDHTIRRFHEADEETKPYIAKQIKQINRDIQRNIASE